MTFAELHRESQELVARAVIALNAANFQEARGLFERAAESELRAIETVEADKPRTLGITAVSAASLFYKAHNYERASEVAERWLANSRLHQSAKDQLRELVAAIASERDRLRSEARLVGPTIAVAFEGGEVLFGAVPLQVLTKKLEVIRSLIIRIAESVQGKPYRKFRTPSADTLATYRPFFSPLPAKSFHFAVRMELTDARRAEEIAQVPEAFLNLIGAAARGLSAFQHLVPDADYREEFMRLVSEIAPDGKDVERVVFSALDTVKQQEIVLLEETRKQFAPIWEREAAAHSSDRVRRLPSMPVQEAGLKERSGILRALNLDKDWIQLSSTTGETVQIHGAGAFLDQVRRLLDRSVIVKVFRGPDNLETIATIQLNKRRGS